MREREKGEREGRETSFSFAVYKNCSEFHQTRVRSKEKGYIMDNNPVSVFTFYVFPKLVLWV